MVTRTIKGVVKAGKIELIEKLDAAEGTEVVVSVPVPSKPGTARMMTYGMFADPTRPLSTEDDFKESRGLWEREWERSWNRLIPQPFC